MLNTYEQLIFVSLIELGDGHYWLNDQNLIINHPLRIIGDEKDPSHVVVEISGSIHWEASCGYIEGVTLRKPRINSRAHGISNILVVSGGLTMTQCTLNGNFGHEVLQLRADNPHGNGVTVKDKGRLTLENVGVQTISPFCHLL